MQYLLWGTMRNWHMLCKVILTTRPYFPLTNNAVAFYPISHKSVTLIKSTECTSCITWGWNCSRGHLLQLLQVEWPRLHGVQVVPGLLGEVQGGSGLPAGYHVPTDVELKVMGIIWIRIGVQFIMDKLTQLDKTGTVPWYVSTKLDLPWTWAGTARSMTQPRLLTWPQSRTRGQGERRRRRLPRQRTWYEW